MKSFRSRGLLIGFAMVFATLLASTSLSYLNLQRLRAHNDWVDHSHLVLLELKQLEGAVLESESGMQGYVLTSDDGYLEPLSQSVVGVRDSLHRWRRLTADDPDRRQMLAEFDELVEKWIRVSQDFIAAARAGGLEADRASVTQGAGKAAMDEVRQQIRSLERAEERQLGDRLAAANVTYWTAIISSLISGGLGMLLAAAGFYFAQRSMAARDKQSRALEAVNEQLEHRVRERTSAISEANQALRQEVSEREQAEQKVRLFAEELQRSNRELEQFAAVASHDLQEPLRKIQAFGDRLAGQWRADLNVKGQEYLDRMLASAGRMRTLIDGLLQFARVSTRHQPPVAVDLGRLAREVVGDLEGRLQQTQGKVEVDGLPTIAADPLQMRQLFQNLIGNALKFHRPGVPPEVRIRGRVLPGPPAEGDKTQLGLQCELVVEDNGVGFDSAYTERIFELFQRLHGRDEFEGTGMGLAICKKIVERHGGKITATGTPGQGSRFLVMLPVLHATLGE